MARDLLDQGTKRIDTELAGQPELQATMLDNIGRAYTAIGQYSQASGLLQRAFEIRRKALGANSLDTASTEDALATAMRLQDEYAKADPYFRDALAVRGAKAGREQPAGCGKSHATWASACIWKIAPLKQSHCCGRPWPSTAAVNNDAGAGARNYLALVLERQGNFPEAAQLLREAVEINRRLTGPESADYIVSLHNYAGALIDSGNLDAAESTERQVLALREKISGKRSPGPLLFAEQPGLHSSREG